MTITSIAQLCEVFLVSACGCILCGPAVVWVLRTKQWLQPIRYEDCPPLLPIQQTKQGTPTMGGLLVLGVAIAVGAMFGGLARPEGWAVVMAGVGLGVIGLIDDLLKLQHPNARGLRCWPKLLAALGIGGGIGWLVGDPVAGYRSVAVPWLSTRLDLGPLWIPYAALVIAGCAHAVNLSDGMDGLAVGCLTLAFSVIGVLAVLLLGSPIDPGVHLVAMWCAGFAGSCLGFLWFNSFPASVFLGDVGALGLGGALGAVALLTHAAFILVIVGGIFVAEALSVMLQVASYRWRNKRRLFRVAPLHHHFQLGGMSEHKVVVRFWIAGTLLAALGLTAFRHS